MYLMINGVRHTVKRRFVSSDTIKYLGVTPEPDTVSGTISMYRNDGFLMSEDDVGKFTRKGYSGTVLLLTKNVVLLLWFQNGITTLALVVTNVLTFVLTLQSVHSQ